MQTIDNCCQISMVDAEKNNNFTCRPHIISVKLALWMQRRMTISNADDSLQMQSDTNSSRAPIAINQVI
jgi:hypothetical protein